MKIYTHTKKGIIRSILRLLPLIAIILLFQSCDNSSTEPVDVYNYLPLEVGRYQIYSVKEEVYSAGVKDAVVTSYQEKDEIESKSTDEQGITTYIFSRSTRNISTDYWQKIKEFSVTEHPDRLLTTIDNQTFLSLVFPIDSKVTWNGNTYNNLDAEDYHYQDINISKQIDTLTFDNTLTVVERKDTSIINRYIGIKQYGLGVGLISDDQTAYEYCQADNCIGTETIESGTHRIRTIVSYGTR